jgi:hypothetical protein
LDIISIVKGIYDVKTHRALLSGWSISFSLDPHYIDRKCGQHEGFYTYCQRLIVEKNTDSQIGD